MTRGKKYEAPFHLDMDFDEALQRFSLTRKGEVDDLLSQTKRAQKGGTAMPLTWWKKLSVTDAQRPTSGRLVPYLRFTKAQNPQNTQTWFRNVFFAGANWVNGHFGRHPVEQTDIDFHVSILGQDMGVRSMMVTHDDTRQDNNNAPNTWLHYDDDTLADFHAQNLAHRVVRVSRSDEGVYSFAIT
jgi:hypothetical protein